MFSQKAGTFGASGRMAPASTMAMARDEVFSTTTLLRRSCPAPGALRSSAALASTVGRRKRCSSSSCGLALRGAAVQNVCYMIQIGNQSSLCAMDCGQVDCGFEACKFAGGYSACANHPPQALLGNFECGFAG